MPAPRPTAPLASSLDDPERARDLARMKRLATGLFLVAAQVLFALNGRYLINEKGAVAEAATCPITVEGLAETQAEIWKEIGDGDYERALRRLRRLSGGLHAILQQAGTKG